MFKVESKINGALGRAGVLHTSHGEIKTPAFATVGTKATVKALTPEQVRDTGSQVVLANTFHLFLQPGERVVKMAGGLNRFMNWPGPTITDSGGFQVFSLGAAFSSEKSGGTKRKISKIAKVPADENIILDDGQQGGGGLAIIDEDGVSFRDPSSGAPHRLTPERSIEIQRSLGADVIFSFDECTSPFAPHEYQKEAMERTHRWAERCLVNHRNKGESKIRRITREILKIEEEKEINPTQQLFGIVQGGRFEDLRKDSARVIGKMDFDGFGIGGSFGKADIDEALRWVNIILPEEKPRHLLGIGEPVDLILGVENGADLFDCVIPTRMGRNGGLFTKNGKINITNSKFKKDFSRIEDDCRCYTCQNYTMAYLAHLFKAREMLAATLASIHNLYFINNLMSEIRKSILEGYFPKFKDEFLKKYKS